MPIKPQDHVVWKMPASFYSRAWLLSGSIGYVSCFDSFYRQVLVPVHESMGFRVAGEVAALVATAYLLAIVPSVWLPIRLSRPSQLIYWILYLVVFVPGLVSTARSGYVSTARAYSLMFTLFAGFTLVGLTYLLPLFPAKAIRISPRVFWCGLWVCVLGSTTWMVIVFRDQMRLVGFMDVYSLRFAANDTVNSSGSLVGYASGIMSGALNPLLMTWGLFHKKRLLFVTGAAGQLLIYATNGMKAVLLSVLFILFFYLLVKWQENRFGFWMVWGCTAIFLAQIVVVTSEFLPGQSIVGVVLSLLLMRMFGIPGLLIPMYDAFFQSSHLTYWSHVHVVNLFVKYPYSLPLGVEVGRYYSGNFDYNASAGFWATDGIAAFGLPGVIIVSMICAALFWGMDSVLKRQDMRFCAVALTYSALNVADNPLFTTIFSFGLGAIVILLFIMPKPSGNAPSSVKLTGLKLVKASK
jgi:hypothetical protein